MSCDSKESFSFTLPIATSSPQAPNTSYLERALERELENHRRKTEEMKLEVRRKTQLMLASIENGLHYRITDEENQAGSILKSERNTKKTKSELNKNSAQCVRFALDSNLSLGLANCAESPTLPKEDKTNLGWIEDKENCQPVVLKRRNADRKVKRKNSQISKSSTQSGATTSGETSSKCSALKQDKITDTRNLTTAKSIHYKIASVTPKPNLKSPAILRKPKPGEVVISMNGSPLLVSSIQGSTQMPQLSIPISEERILVVHGEEGLEASDFPFVDSQTKAELTNIHNFLEQVLENEN